MMMVGGSGAFLEWDKLLLKLPSQQRIREIILKMQTITVMKKLLPPNLEYVASIADKALLQNIQALFPPTVAASGSSSRQNEENASHTELILNTLLTIVLRTDDFMSESQKQKISMQSASLRKDQQRDLLLFYPCLMALIRALLIHCQNLAVQMKDEKQSQDSGSSVRKCVLDVWQQIMGELHDLHSVIIYASKQGLIELGNFPVEWLQTIQSMNSDIAHLRNIILGLNDSLNLEQAQLNERDKKLQAIMAQYAEADTKVQLIKAQKNNVVTTLESYVSIPDITHENITRIESAFSPH